MSNVNTRMDDDITSYYHLGKLLLQSSTPKIIFVDEPMYQRIQSSDYNPENTLILLYHKSDSYLYEYIYDLSHFQVNTDNPKKDTIEFMFTMCNKTEWMKKAIDCDIFQSSHFIWIDFGIRKVFKCSDEQFVQKLNLLQRDSESQSNSYSEDNNMNQNKVRIGRIWDLSIQYQFDILRDITWYFAGGVFGGNKESLIQFSQIMKEKCIEIMTKYKTIMWEVNVWYLLYKQPEYTSLFDPYISSHFDSILDNY